MVRSQSTGKSNKTSPGGRCVRLNPESLKRMVEEIIVRRYGTTSIGFSRYRVERSALDSIRVSAEKFLTTMWNEVHDIAVKKNRRVTVEHEDFVEWRRQHITTPRKPKLIGGKTLCELFESIKKNDDVPVPSRVVSWQKGEHHVSNNR